MPYTPYILQTILPSLEDPSVTAAPTHPPQSPPFFSRRTTSQPNDDARLPSTPTNSSILSNLHGASSISGRPSIVCVEAWAPYLYLGTSDGQVILYTLDEHANKTSSVELSYTARPDVFKSLRVGKKPVERILALPQVSKIAVLCDGTLSFYDPIHLSAIDTIKGITAFSLDAAEEDGIGEDGKIELCVVRQRMIQVFKIGELVEFKKEIPITYDAILMTRCGNTILLADGQQYNLVHIMQSKSISLTEWQPQVLSKNAGSQIRPCPLTTVVKGGEFLVVVASENNQSIGVFMDDNGNPIRGTLSWPSYPKALCVEFPYIVALLQNNTIVIHGISDQSLLQVIQLRPSFEARGMSLGKGITLHIEELSERLQRRIWPDVSANTSPGDADSLSMGEIQRKVAKYSTMPARILVYGRNSVKAQLVKPLVTQIDALLESHQVEEALKVTDETRESMTFDNNGYVMRLRSEIAYVYQKCGFLLLKETLFEDAFSRLSMGDIDPRVVIHLFRELSIEKYRQGEPRVFLFEDVRIMMEQMGSIEDIVASNIERNYDLSTEDEHQRRSPQMDLRGILLKNAREEVEKYLRKERLKRKEDIGKNTVVCKAIDTAILKLSVDNDSIIQFLVEPNDCCPADCAEFLFKAKRYYALSLLYESKRMYEKLLEIWTRIYTGELKDPAFKDGLDCVKRLLLKDLAIYGVPLSAISHYTWWLISQSPADGIDVLVRVPHTAGMNSDEILKRLEDYGNEAVRTYLEYLVLTRNSESSEHHTRLARSYVYDIQQEIQKNQPPTAIDLVEEFKLYLNQMRTKDMDDSMAITFVSFLGEKKVQIPLVKNRLLLLRLLQRSSLYAAETLLEELSKAGPLNIEKAIVLGRLGRHEDALCIMINDLEDFAGAETYCITNGRSAGMIPEIHSLAVQPIPPARTSSLPPQRLAPEAVKHLDPKKEGVEEKESLTPEEMTERMKLCTLLLKIYLKSEQTSRKRDNRSSADQFMRARSLHLVNTQGLYLDTLEVLRMIPDDWPVQVLQDFFVRSLGRTLYDYREGVVGLAMSRGENILAENELFKIYEEIGPLRLNQRSKCEQCLRPLEGEIFVKDRRPMHLHCAELLGVVDDDNVHCV